ncbi:MAG: alpha/beta hydrolase [Kofleriaceae bacterium]
MATSPSFKTTVSEGMVVRRCGVGRELVWIHGLGESSTSFEPVVAALPQFQHTLIDLPNYGRSPHGDVLSLDELADKVAPLTRGKLVIGHSMGGVLAVLLAERGAAASIVNIDGNISRGDCTFSGRAIGWTEAEFVAHGFAEMKDAVYREGIAKLPLRGYHAAMCFASAAQFYRHAQNLVELSLSESLARRMSGLSVPHLFVAGVPDGICEKSRALLTGVGANWIGIEPAGHWVYLDQTESFACAIVLHSDEQNQPR